MNRSTKRKAERVAKKQQRQKFSLIQLQKAFAVAHEMVKESGGHLFSRSLKNRCVFCGKTQRVKVDCKYWFGTYLDRVQSILINPDFFRYDELEGQFMQEDNAYKQLRITEQPLER